MRILVISQYYYPEQFRINDICAELVKRGNIVTVLTGQPNYPDGEIFTGYEKYIVNEEHDGVKIIRCKIHPRHKGSLNLLKNYLSFVYSASKKIGDLGNEYDVIYMYQLSPITSAIPALKMKKKYGIPIFLYCCDIWPDSVRDISSGTMSIYNPIYIISKWISQYIYKHVDRIGVKCNQFIEYLYSICEIEKRKCCLIYEHAEDSYLTVSSIPEKNGIYDFMFLGNIGIAQHCDYILKASERIHTNVPFKVHFVGSGSGLESLYKYVEKHHLQDKVVFHGRYPISTINQFYEYADCCMLTLSAKTATGLTPPAKLVGYMAASRPVIAAAEGATVNIIQESGCGITVEPEDVEGLSNAMLYAIQHQNEFIDKGINGRSFFTKYFTLQKHVDSLEEEFSKMMV